MPQSSPLEWSRRPAFVNYAVAVLSVAAALIAALLLATRMQVGPYALLFLCAIMFSAWFGGLGPGLLATALSVMGFTYYFIILSRRSVRSRLRLRTCRASSCLR
jgi:K+-sensing histidine kinase KdpD